MIKAILRRLGFKPPAMYFTTIGPETQRVLALLNEKYGKELAVNMTDPLYADHLKVFELREYLRSVRPQLELTGYGHGTAVVNRIRDIIGDAEYREF